MSQWVGAQGCPKVDKISKTCPHCDVSTRNPHRKRKTFFSMLTRRLVDTVEQWFLTGGTKSQNGGYAAPKISGIHALKI